MLPFRLIKTHYVHILVDNNHNIVYYNTLINQIIGVHMIDIKEMALNMLTGLSIMLGLTVVVVGYGYLISLFNLTETAETVILFLPLVLFAAYNMGALRRIK
mgnify:CR=1 FL=1